MRRPQGLGLDAEEQTTSTGGSVPVTVAAGAPDMTPRINTATTDSRTTHSLPTWMLGIAALLPLPAACSLEAPNDVAVKSEASTDNSCPHWSMGLDSEAALDAVVAFANDGRIAHRTCEDCPPSEGRVEAKFFHDDDENVGDLRTALMAAARCTHEPLDIRPEGGRARAWAMNSGASLKVTLPVTTDLPDGESYSRVLDYCVYAFRPTSGTIDRSQINFGCASYSR